MDLSLLKLIEQDPDYHSVYTELAKVYQLEGMNQEAYDLLKKSLKIDEFNKELYFMAGKLANEFGDYKNSEMYIREAVILDNDYKEAVIFLIKILKDKDRHNEIIELIDDIKHMGAEDPDYDWELARSYNEIEKYDKAYEYYQLAANLLDTDAIFLKEYGYFLLEDGRSEQAVQIFKKYLEIDPLDSDIIGLLNRIEL